MPLRARPNAAECVKARVLAGLSVAQAAAQIPCSSKSLYNLENGDTRTRPGLIKALADLYGVPVESLLIFEPKDTAA